MSAIYITGVPGVGKSALVTELISKGILAFDVDDICAWINKTDGTVGNYYPGIGKDWVQAHSWICDISILEKTLKENEGKTIVAAGVTFNQNDYLSLFDKIILLHCPSEVFIGRLKSRNSGNQYGKGQWERDDIFTWIEDFEFNLIKKGAIKIDTNRRLESIVEDVLNEFV